LQIGIGHLGVALLGEQQRDVDGHSVGDGLGYGGQGLERARDLDHHVGPAHQLVQAQGFGMAGFGVAGQFRRQFDADIAVPASGCGVRPAQQVGRGPDVFHGQGLEELLGRGVVGGQAAHGVVVVVGRG
jgi:hypothetical protein